jgi:hypothetical protein
MIIRLFLKFAKNTSATLKSGGLLLWTGSAQNNAYIDVKYVENVLSNYA